MDFLKPEVAINFDTPNRNEAIKSIQKNVNGRNNAVLGRGAYGIVLRAKYKRCNVAVKILDKKNYNKYSSLKKESNILNLQHHENIIGILKIVDCKTHGAVIMERFEGKSLQFVLNHFHIDLFHRLHILSDIARALDCCHKHKIVHLDVKPQNVFVAVNSSSANDRRYTCKLFDFGSSFFEDSFHEGDSYEQLGGTVRYSSPEVLLGNKPDFTADIFALAVLMWQLKENKIPYESIHDNETIIWNVVKNDMRPDTLTLSKNSKTNASNKNLSRKFCKSESFLRVTQLMDFQLTPKSSNRNIEKVPEILVNKRIAEKSSTGSSKRTRLGMNKNQLVVRKKLFGSISSPSDEVTDVSCNVDMQNLFLDEMLHKRVSQRIQWIESEYVRTYKNCWKRVKSQRYHAIKLLSVYEKLVNSLNETFIIS